MKSEPLIESAHLLIRKDFAGYGIWRIARAYLEH